jgi:hypothetical protein
MTGTELWQLEMAELWQLPVRLFTFFVSYPQDVPGGTHPIGGVPLGTFFFGSSSQLCVFLRCVF